MQFQANTLTNNDWKHFYVELQSREWDANSGSKFYAAILGFYDPHKKNNKKNIFRTKQIKFKK